MQDFFQVILIALIASSPGLIAIWRQLRRDKVELALAKQKDNSSVAETYEGMASRQAVEISRLNRELKQCQDNIAQLEDKMTSLRKEVTILEAGINVLLNQLEANDIVPAWKPKKKLAT